MDVNLNYLISFVELAKTLNFSKASKNLNMAQPGLSRQIKQLEESLQVSLFRRDNKRVVLTQDGASLLDEISGPLDDILNGLIGIKESSDKISGKIVIACPLEFGEYVIVPICNEFIKAYPNILISFKFTSMSEVPKLLLDGKVDFGIGLKSLDQENIRSFKLIEQDSYLLSAGPIKDLSMPVEQMKFAGYIENDPLIERFVKKHIAKTSKFKFQLSFMANSHSAIVSYLESHPHSFGVLPYYSSPVREAIESKRLFKVGEKAISSGLFLLTSVEESMPARKKIFKSFLVKAMASIK